MTPRLKLGNMRLRDVKDLLVKDPVITSPDRTIEELLDMIIKNPRARDIYVTDQNGCLIGSVCMDTVVKYLFPFEAAVERSTELSVHRDEYSEAKTVADIMDDGPRFVKEAASLSDIAHILMRENICELPVVDDQMHITGQIGMNEVIAMYLKEIHPEHAESDRQINTGNKS